MEYPICARCGQPELPYHQHKVREWICPHCSSRLPPKAYVCPKCKTHFDGNYNEIDKDEWSAETKRMNMGSDFNKGDDTTRRKE